MRRRRRSDPTAETIIVKTDDGKTFRCVIVSTDDGAQPHWALMDEHAEQYIGPPVLADHSVEAVSRQISDWWAQRRQPTKAEPEPASAAQNKES